MPKPTFFNLPRDKRDRLVAAAVAVFAGAPLPQAKLADVAQQADVSKGSLYQYFHNKLDLYTWLLTEHLPAAKVAAIAQHAPAQDASVWEVLRHAIAASVAFARACPQLARLGARFAIDQHLHPELVPIAQAHRVAGLAWLEALVTRGQAKGDLRGDLHVPTVATVWAHLLGDGVMDLLAQRLGTHRHALLADLTPLHTLTQADLAEVTAHLLSVLQHGTAPTPGATP